VRNTGLTFAPEAGTQRLRDIINKNITDDDIFSAVREAFEGGTNGVKLYFMIGLPGETDDDVNGIADMAARIRGIYYGVPKEKRGGGFKLTVSVSNFVPKPHTPFQWEPQDDMEELYRKQRHEKMNNACTFIRNGAHFLATHLDLNCPTEDGFIPDCGSMCAMVEASTGVKPRYLGKPFRETVDMIKLITGKKDEELAFVGDRLYTDIAAGVKNGITGILVLTGETGLQDIEKSEVKPNFIFESLAALGEAL
jgi:hypothetical protein